MIEINLNSLVKETFWNVCSCKNNLKDINITTGYCSDLISDVIGNAPSQSLWITIQTHENIVAASLLRELGAVLVTGGKKIPPETLKRAEEEGIVLLSAEDNSYQCACLLNKILEKEE